MRKFNYVLLASLMVFALLLAACGPAPTPTEAPKATEAPTKAPEPAEEAEPAEIPKTATGDRLSQGKKKAGKSSGTAFPCRNTDTYP